MTEKMPSSQRKPEAGSGVVVILAIVLLIVLVAGVVPGIKKLKDSMGDGQTARAPVTTGATTGLAKIWSVNIHPPRILELALSPTGRGEFLALNGDDHIHRFDSSGERRDQFRAPEKSSRLVTDPSGRFPYSLIVSSKSKWTGAIDFKVPTDYYLQALDGRGTEVWKVRLDPKQVSVLDPVVATIDRFGYPAILLSASQRILCFSANGTRLWDAPVRHYPGTLAAADLDGDGVQEILAARTPLSDIVRIDASGQALGPWVAGHGPTRLRAEPMRGSAEVYAATLRQVFRPQPGGVQLALSFFASNGNLLGEFDLPKNASLPSHSPLAAIDLDGSGRRSWIMALGDGSIHLFSPSGGLRKVEHIGQRIRTFLVLPRPNAPDLLIVATQRGLTAWSAAGLAR